MDVAPEYADIRQVESSTAVLYLFSERFMTYGKAYGLCEWFGLCNRHADAVRCAGDERDLAGQVKGFGSTLCHN